MYTETTQISSTGALQLSDHAKRHRNPKSQKKAFPFHCLVVDDEQRSRRIVTQMIKALGHEADMAKNGDHGFRKFAANGHNLVVTDLDMPHLDGFSLTLKIKKVFRDAKIVIMTGRCQAEVSQMMASGLVDAWLFKPFGMDELCKVLEALEPAVEKHAG